MGSCPKIGGGRGCDSPLPPSQSLLEPADSGPAGDRHLERGPHTEEAMTLLDGRTDTAAQPAPPEPKPAWRARVVAVCLALVTVAFLQDPGRIAADTQLRSEERRG